MSDQHQPGDTPQSWEDMLRSMLGDGADEVMAEMRERGIDPTTLGGPPDPVMMQYALAQVQKMLSAEGTGPVNADVAHDVARQVAVSKGDPSLTGKQAKEATDALAVAELWLDAATDLPPAGGTRRAWNRSEWVEATLPVWNELAAPVASSVSEALATVLRDQLPEGIDDGEAIPGMPAGVLHGLGGALDPAQMMRRLGSAVFGMQVGQAAGTLSQEVFGATDVGLPLLDSSDTVLLPTNVSAFAEGLDAPLEEVRQFLAVREAAHARLFTHVPWLRSHLLSIVERYARGITIDLDVLESQVRDIDLADSDALRSALSGGVFGLQNTDEQKSVLLNLETTLALVEGWVDEVSAIAALPHLPHAIPLREMIRRRRAAGGPAEQTFSTLVGLELRPRRSRDAATLFSIVARAQGPEGRDAVWDHPDLLPGTRDLDDPSGYLVRREAAENEHADVDAALKEIFGEDTLTEEAPAGDSTVQDGPAEDAPTEDGSGKDGPSEEPK
ncbi:zinc-dependent metalloprotease [Promicromonospora iranensis]|uniref:Hydrolase n=1 Tax=Promicromonospora iranensis TaxID=1105144 RepID=A0ABU2CM11_9MICO|nr:zinc-dependent metalloprotease [Promicromonospora iranensis]MDR7382357.1 putative hydrolase [Promicromonospora iranensis]